MKVHVLIIRDRDMRPRCDEITTAVFASREAALAAMEADIVGTIDAEQVGASEIERNPGWDNKYFLVGWSDAKKDFPYVLPGICDRWAGSGKYAGRRTQQVNILFEAS